MNILSAAAAIAMIASSGASANPFAPKVTKNTRKAAYTAKLMSNARPTPNSKLGRRLDDAEQDIDISSYSIKFEKCQYIKQFADERNEDTNTVLETKRFVIFRLCPDDDCSSCDYNYGEYIVDMETYLESTLQHKEEEQEQYCEACEECGNDDGAQDADDANNNNNNGGRNRNLIDVNCNSCYAQCQNIENMEDNGYADAAEYVNCEKVYENENTGVSYYAGAICANYGTRIKVGLFTDEDCSAYDPDLQIDQYLKNENGYNVKLSYHLLKQTFVSDGCVASCTKVDEDANDGGDDDAAEAAAAETAEVCENLYEAAGKCESAHGFDDGMDSNSDNYGVQSSNEENVCDFITAISSGHYDEYGDVVVVNGGSRTVLTSSVQTTGGQKFALTFFVIATAGLAAYAALLHQKIKGRSRVDLSTQDVGTMA